MSLTPYVNIARVCKTRGLDGKVTVRITDGLPFCIYEGLDVYVVPPTLYGPRFLVVQSVDVLGDGTVVLGFEDVASIDDAEQMVGHDLLAWRDDLDLAAIDDYEQLIGRDVCDEVRGPLGQVTEIIETPGNDVLVIEGGFGEVLIPLVEEMVLDIPEDASQPIRTRAVEGLIE